VLIRDALKRTWDDDLARYYGLAISSDVAKQLATAETWLKSQSHNPSLLLSLGRLSILNQLWGKARSYLESSLDLAPSAETYRELGRLLDLRGEEVLANECYRKGLLATA
jgi:HemY protein